MAGCANAPSVPWESTNQADQLRLVNRITWGANSSSMHLINEMGDRRYLEAQLHPEPDAKLPGSVQAQVIAMQISQKSMVQLVEESEQQRKAADSKTNDDEKKTAQQAYQQQLNQLAREAAQRSLLRDLYSPWQLQEQMTWFWMNHFSVHQYKGNLRAMLADYEDQIRAHALGRFRDLLAVTVHHPAMLRYLDNEHNAQGHLNENYARELMELHTLGVGSGYSQHDVQELARILTGFGVNQSDNKPRVKRELQDQYLRDGLFEFNPNRHDYGDKIFLGKPVHGRGMAEVDEVLDRLARHPATAHFLSQKLAMYFVGDTPPEALVERMAQTYLRTDGQISEVLRTLFYSPEFKASLGGKFKDPVHYVVSSVRLAYDDKTILNAGPMLNWLNRMGEPLYGHQTPEGYPLNQSAWASSGQMATRFEIAKVIGSSPAGLFRGDALPSNERAAFPQLANALYYQYWQASLGPTTRAALDQAGSAQEWNTFLLASPEFMNR
ncbi:MAG: DUF1800 domain-containing protein [Formivibrio sp.]|nr:DUF1800 domain-containing protein [Formivibrio sp.]